MEVSQITQLVTSVGFPIVMCGAMAWYVKYITDQHRKDSIDRTTIHTQEMNDITEALNNNTLVIQHLCDMLGKELK